MDEFLNIEKDLAEVFPEDSQDITVAAARYSLMAGGKRIRPRMMYMTYQMLTGADQVSDDVRYFAATLEMIHTYSLIHDDLPCMDNDDLRRGKPTCHKKFGEGVATLAGDLLLNSAMERLFRMLLDKPEYAYACYKMASLAGGSGMIGGQSIDISSEGKRISLDTLYELQRKKTGALIETAVVTPYYLLNKVDMSDPLSDDVLDRLIRFAGHIGLAFQIRDDILDVDSDPSVLGKSTGKDERDNKSTFVTLLGYEEAKVKLDNEIGMANAILDELGSAGFKVGGYRELTEYLRKRKN